MRRVLLMALLPLVLMSIVTALAIQSVLMPDSQAQLRAVAARNVEVGLTPTRADLYGLLPQPDPYLYYTLKLPAGFVLARASRGSSGQPLTQPQPVAGFGNGFGLLESDEVLSMQLSPDGRYLAIDGTRDHGEQVWVYNTQGQTLSLVPPYVLGNFLHWLPDLGHTFLYRPMLPLGPSAPMDGNTWNPGLWEVDAARGEHTNIDIGVASAFLVDAAPSPDGSLVVYSTTAGLGMGSATWLMTGSGANRRLLFSNPGGAQSIAGFFAWSPDGKSIAYERLSDSPTPFLPAALWVMNDQGDQQRLLAQADGGHGYGFAWSPDSRRIAFVMRTNVGDRRADTDAQSQQSAIAIVDLPTAQSWIAASPAETGLQINANPAWIAGGASVVFTAFNPINRVLGGSPRYWSARITNPLQRPSLALLTPAIMHVAALES